MKDQCSLLLFTFNMVKNDRHEYMKENPHDVVCHFSLIWGGSVEGQPPSHGYNLHLQD